LHLFIYPASNGYNSYQDKDETSIGGLKNPPKVTRQLFYITLWMDAMGVLLAMYVSIYFSIFVLIYMLVSRAYSYRKLRLKKYAVAGFFTVFIFQGAFTFAMATFGVSLVSINNFFTENNIICMSIASLFIGSVYPLTQIYQHDADKKDGVTSISYKLGYTGTFVFSGIMFASATVLLFYYFDLKHQRVSVLLFFTLMLPVIIKLFKWFAKVRDNSTNANFENTMSMNLIASVCMNIYFLILTLNTIYSWF
jgi:1,4-dihydroxy-2-naphthoate octaprenyltransferase